MKNLLIGEDPFDTSALWEKLYTFTAMSGRRGAVICAIGAIDMALWDIKGKYFNMPVWKLLGGAQKSVPAYITFGLRTYSHDELVEAAKMWVAEGQNRLKMMVGRLNVHGKLDMRGTSAEHREEDPGEEAQA